MARYLIDIDGTIARTRGMDYENAQPVWDAIEEVKRIHAQGHEVVIKTSRGARTGVDYTDMTREQLRSWGLIEGAGYDELRVGYEFFDEIIDDRATNALDWRAGIQGDEGWT